MKVDTNIKRVPSLGNLEPESPHPLITNPNVSYISTPLFHVFYVSLICAFIFFAYLCTSSSEATWTITNITHSVITFLMMHWIKGSPFFDKYKPHGKYDRMTFWEQIDDQVQFTRTRKFFQIVPVVLLIVTSYTAYKYIVLNTVVSLFVIVPKLPSFHRVRLFGINS